MTLLCKLLATIAVMFLIENVNAGDRIIIPEPKSGTCPRPRYTLEDCKLIKFVSCDNDQSCIGNLKCCFNGCGKSCADPSQVKPPKPCGIKPGRCPLPSLTADKCPLVLLFPCDDDLSCPDDQKCCQSGCGFTCTPPAVKPGTCPPPLRRPCILPIPKDTCNHDFGCKGTKRCCFDGCSQLCLEPQPKAGKCPVSFAKMFYPGCELRGCEIDDDCEGALKCCNNGCGGSQCLQPSEKPGTCPQSLAAAATSQVDPNARCTTDYDCPGDSKCCSDIIGQPICSPPNPVVGPQ